MKAKGSITMVEPYIARRMASVLHAARAGPLPPLPNLASSTSGEEKYRLSFPSFLKNQFLLTGIDCTLTIK